MTAFSARPVLVPDGEAWTLVLERVLAHPPARVWAALTETSQHGGWAPFVADRDLTSPGPIALTDRGVAEPRTVEGLIRVADAPRLLVVEWGDDTLRWELDASGGSTGEDAAQTRLTLRHRFTDREQAPSYAAGWHLCFDALAAALAGTPMASVVGESAMAHGWSELRDRYAEQLLGPRSAS